MHGGEGERTTKPKDPRVCTSLGEKDHCGKMAVGSEKGDRPRQNRRPSKKKKKAFKLLGRTTPKIWGQGTRGRGGVRQNPKNRYRKPGEFPPWGGVLHLVDSSKP